MSTYTVEGRRKDRNRYLSLVTAGLCTRCKQPHDGTTQRCQPCTAACVESNRRAKRAARERGSCVECLAPWVGETQRCTACKARQREKWSNRAASVNCSRCGQPKDGASNSCSTCRAEMRGYANHRRESFRSSGRCVQCGKPRTGPSTYCDEHILRLAAYRWLGDADEWPRLLDHLIAQAGRCAYTGEPVTLGSNASLDHKIPRSRGGPNELANVHWVTWQVNRAKSDMTHDDFLEMCRAVARMHP